MVAPAGMAGLGAAAAGGGLGAAVAGGGAAAVAAPVLATMAVGFAGSIALGTLCLKTVDTMKELDCFEKFRWYCYPLATAAVGQCAGSAAAGIGSGAMFVKPELFKQMLDNAKEVTALLAKAK